MEQQTVYNRRLKRLAQHMLSFTPEDNAKHFRMRIFLEHDRKELKPLEALVQGVLADCYCETVACAVGHAPALFPTLVKKYNKEHAVYDDDGNPHDASYRKLSEFLFGIRPGSNLFEFMFGSDWDSGTLHNYNSTSWAVADRIMYHLRTDTMTVFDTWRYECVRQEMITHDEIDKRMKKLAELETGPHQVRAFTTYE